MEKATEGWKDESTAQLLGDGEATLKAVNHRTRLIGVVYATTIIVVLMIVSRL